MKEEHVEKCLCRVKGSGRKSMSEETVDKIRQKIVNSPKKFIRGAVCRVSFVIVSYNTPNCCCWNLGFETSPSSGLLWTAHNFLANFIYRFF